jgi:hypothetical protein
MTIRNSDQFDNFDHTMRKLMSVSHSEIKAKLDAEKAAKKSKRDQPKPRSKEDLNDRR